MAETESKRRGRPRKAAQDAAPAQAEVAAPAQTEAAVEVSPVEQITHKFMRGVYREGTNPLQALTAAQDELFTQIGVVESFQALHSMAGLGLEEAKERRDQELIDALTSRQRAFSSALRRLNPAAAGSSPLAGPSNPSQLPMTGRKG